MPMAMQIEFVPPSASEQWLRQIFDRLDVAGDDRAPMKARFEQDFEAALSRLETARLTPSLADMENLESALGAAAIGEHELATAFMDASWGTAGRTVEGGRATRRANNPFAIAGLRHRFKKLLEAG